MDQVAAFDLVCACLAETGDDSLRRRLRETTDWPALVRSASGALVATNLHRALLDKSLTGAVPDEVRLYLEGAHELNTARNETLAEQLEAAAMAMNAAGIEPLLLKGMANLVDGVYADTGVRMIGDVDLLVRADQLDTAREALVKAGFRQLKEMREDQHLPPMARPTDVAHVELHAQVHTGRVATVLATDEMFADATRARAGRGKLLVPSATHRVLHNIIHTQIQDAHYWRMQVSLRQLCDLVSLRRRYDPAIDWELVRNRMRAAGFGGALAHYVGWAEHLLEQPRPAEIPRHRSEALARLMQRQQKRRRWALLLANSLIKLTTSLAWLRRRPGLAIDWTRALLRPGHLRLTIKRLGFRV